MIVAYHRPHSKKLSKMKNLLVIAKQSTDGTIVLSVPKTINVKELGTLLNRACNDLNKMQSENKLTGEISLLTYSSEEVSNILFPNTPIGAINRVIAELGDPRYDQNWNSSFWEHINDDSVIKMLQAIRDNGSAEVILLLKQLGVEWIIGYVNNFYKR